MGDFKIELGNDKAFHELRNKFVDWYLQAKPYEWFTYHHGIDLHQSMVVEAVRQATWAYATKGLVYLFTQKDPERKGHWFFRCQKSKNPTPRLVPKP